jgi:hypothetical protein
VRWREWAFALLIAYFVVAAAVFPAREWQASYQRAPGQWQFVW